MMKYRKKPGVIEAVQVTPQNLYAISELSPDVEVVNLHDQEPTMVSVKTLHGVVIADPGDWIIKGTAGDFWPCKPDIFDATYEPAME